MTAADQFGGGNHASDGGFPALQGNASALAVQHGVAGVGAFAVGNPYLVAGADAASIRKTGLSLLVSRRRAGNRAPQIPVAAVLRPRFPAGRAVFVWCHALPPAMPGSFEYQRRWQIGYGRAVAQQRGVVGMALVDAV